MQKKIFAILIFTSIVLVSILVVIAPSFSGVSSLARKSLQKKLDLDLILNDNKDVKLVFFGYSSCPDICSPRLSSLNHYYNSIDEINRKRIGVEFLDISTPVDKTLPQRYAEFFNPEFKGIYLNTDILRVYTKAFNVFFSKSFIDKTEYDHTAHLYIIQKVNKTKYLRYIYNTYPYDFKQINKDIKGLLNEPY